MTLKSNNKDIKMLGTDECLSQCVSYHEPACPSCYKAYKESVAPYFNGSQKTLKCKHCKKSFYLEVKSILEFTAEEAYE